MHTKKKIWLACGIPLGLVGGLFLWLALWANHWENRCETFKRDAESQGESFAIASQVKPKVPDEENFLEYPWVKSVAAGKVPNHADHQKIKELLEQIRGKTGKEPDPMQSPEVWMSDAKVLLDFYHNDLNELKQSTARTSYWREDRIESNPWSPLSLWMFVLELQYLHHSQLNERDLMIEDLKIFSLLAKHARSEPSGLSQLVSLSIEKQVCQLIQYEIKKRQPEPELKKLLLEILSQQKPWLDEEIALGIRWQRNMLLDMMPKNENQQYLFSKSNQFRELWQKNIFVRRTFLARNRLALCEDLQTTILVPYYRNKKLEAHYFQDYLEAEERRYINNSSYELFVRYFPNNTRVYEKSKTIEVERNDLIQQLSQSP
jgi:DNA-binding TFAR19-related protein (PDSD5 family)